jgi:hypothetical protein
MGESEGKKNVESEALTIIWQCLVIFFLNSKKKQKLFSYMLKKLCFHMYLVFVGLQVKQDWVAFN